MNIFNGGIEEAILQILLSSSKISIEDLIKRVGQKRGGVTKQGVYRVLRKLKSEGKIVVYKSSVSINLLWTERLHLLTDRRAKSSMFGNLGYMREKEKIIIEGKTLVGTDDLWSDAFINIENRTHPKHPLFLYNPHNWTILLRPETDKIHTDRLVYKQRPIFLSIGARTALDRETVRIMSQDKIHCSLSSKLKDQNYIAVLGNYVFLVKLSRKGNALIDTIFHENISTEEAAEEIKRINQKISAKITIERNETRAKEFKKKIARDFFVPKQNRDF
jgi:DNA-binding Lrp family transcriptional regulator